MVGMRHGMCATPNIKQASGVGRRADTAPTQAPECIGGVVVGTADQAWPPTVVDLLAVAPQRKEPTRVLLATPSTDNTNMRILPLIVLFGLAWQATARPQDDEPRAVSNRGAILKRGLAGKQKTTTTTPAPDEAEYEDEGDYPAEEVQEPSTEAAPSSTEGKKLVGGLPIRPFRSNTDLLEALKRRRAQAVGAKSGGSSSVAQQQTETQTEAPVKANFSKKRFNTATRETKAEEAPAPAPSKPSRGRFGRPASRSVQEAEPEEQNDTTPPARTGRTFRRGGN
ncbi:uncharacterized protein LOC123880062 [Maniola jurtina]|uniref:uncharacterized protein LOC123880062 n=1 Tax=Maniola jurtina TaxID=191418 RepID=UPI001E6890CB|nr:uncharacterized protein LOC123880062 [Maniola jurtina]